MKCKKTPLEEKIKPCPTEDSGTKTEPKTMTSSERTKYDAGHRMRVRDQDGRTKHRDFDGQKNHKPH